MTKKAIKIKHYDDNILGIRNIKPFDNVEEAWFWFIAAQQARNDGARFSADCGAIQRPCEPVDILKILDGLYRQRRLLREHFLVLRHYGRRNMPPDPRRVKEARASILWKEAMERMIPVMERKGIIRKEKWYENDYDYGHDYE